MGGYKHNTFSHSDIDYNKIITKNSSIHLKNSPISPSRDFREGNILLFPFTPSNFFSTPEGGGEKTPPFSILFPRLQWVRRTSAFLITTNFLSLSLFYFFLHFFVLFILPCRIIFFSFRLPCIVVVPMATVWIDTALQLIALKTDT